VQNDTTCLVANMFHWAFFGSTYPMQNTENPYLASVQNILICILV